MKTSNVQLDFLHESYSVALYDMSIQDVKERFEKRLLFPIAVKAANFLGIIPKNFYDKIGRGKYMTHRETKIRYAVRKIPQIAENENKAQEGLEKRSSHVYVPGVPKKPKIKG